MQGYHLFWYSEDQGVIHWSAKTIKELRDNCALALERGGDHQVRVIVPMIVGSASAHLSELVDAADDKAFMAALN